MHLIQRAITNRRFTAQAVKYVRGYVSATNKTSSALVEPVPDGTITPVSPKLAAIVDQIAQLNLLEVSELSTLLKKTLNLPDAPMVSYGAPVAAAAPAEEDEVAAGPAVIQTAFKVKIVSYDESKKIPLIKEIKKQCEGVNLVQAKKILEALPSFIKEDVSKDEAAAFKETFEKFGAVIEVV